MKKIIVTDDYYNDLREGEILTVNSHDERYGVYECYKEGFFNNTAIVGESHCKEID